MGTRHTRVPTNVVVIVTLLALTHTFASGGNVRSRPPPKSPESMVVGRVLEVEREGQEQQENLVVPGAYTSSSKISRSAGITSSTIGILEQNVENGATTTKRILKPKKNNIDETKKAKKGKKAEKKAAKAQATPRKRDDTVPPTPSPILVPPVPAPTMVPPVPAPTMAPPVATPTMTSPVPPSTMAPIVPTVSSSGYGLQANCLQDDQSTFNVCLDMASIDGTYKSWMDAALNARDRWQSVIAGDTFPAFSYEEILLTDIATDLPTMVDDMYLAVFEANIDGVNNILGDTVVTYTKKYDDFYVLPVAARIRLDVADIPMMVADNSIPGVLEHELGHALGFGSLWVDNDLHTGSLTDPDYYGFYAQEAWKVMGCSGEIPIETEGGAGTAGVHWDEGCMDKELMTGISDVATYLSNLTVGALLDLGYTVNLNAADPFTLDQLSKTECAASCPEARGNFTKQDAIAASITSGVSAASSYVEGNTTSIAETQAENRDAILSAAADVLQKNRANAPLSVPEGFRYVAGDSVTVLTRGSDGRIKGTVVTWEEVQGYISSEEQVVV